MTVSMVTIVVQRIVSWHWKSDTVKNNYPDRHTSPVMQKAQWR